MLEDLEVRQLCGRSPQDEGDRGPFTARATGKRTRAEKQGAFPGKTKFSGVLLDHDLTVSEPGME